MKRAIDSDRSTRARRQESLSTVNLLISRGKEALHDRSIKLTISEYLRSLSSQLESQPSGPVTVVWFDDVG